MATPIRVGDANPLLQHWELSFGKDTGNTVSREFKGIDLNRMGSLCDSYARAGASGSLRFEGSIATLTIRSGNTNGLGITPPGFELTDKWELGVDSERPDLCENTNFLRLFEDIDEYFFNLGLGLQANAVSQQFFAALRGCASGDNPTRKGLKEKLEGTDLVDAEGELVPVVPGSTTGYSLQFIISNYGNSGAGIWNSLVPYIDDYLRGATTFVRGKYVLRHTTNAPDDYSATVADFNVENIYTIAELLTEVQDGGLWVLPIPEYLAYKIQNAPPPITMPSNYVWGALKMRSNAVEAALNRIEITTEYLIDAWPVHTYGTVS